MVGAGLDATAARLALGLVDGDDAGSDLVRVKGLTRRRKAISPDSQAETNGD